MQWFAKQTITEVVVLIPSANLVLPPVVVGFLRVCLVGSSRPVVSLAEQIYGETFAILLVGVVARKRELLTRV